MEAPHGEKEMKQIHGSYTSKQNVISKISAKEVWKEKDTSRIEEQCMSPFIGDVIDEISDITGYNLIVQEYEVQIGDFRADIICKDENTGSIVIIENQLENTDHSHLGKSITYLANLDAVSIIWICEKFRDEHKKAIEKLNEITSDEYNFYALELVFEKYANNAPYYYFNKVVIPSTINKIANSVKCASQESRDIITFLGSFIPQIINDCPYAKVIKNKTYAQLYKNSSSLYCAIQISSKTSFVTFEIGVQCWDAQSISKLSNHIDTTMPNYHFIQSTGVRNEEYTKWKFTYNTPYFECQEKIKEISKAISSVLVKFNL